MTASIREVAMHFRLVAYGFAGGLAGTLIALVVAGTELNVKPVNLTWEEVAALVLGCVAVLVTALGVLVAVAAIWGFRGIKGGAESAAVNHVSEQLKGKLGDRLEDAFERYIDAGMTDGSLRRMLEQRVDLMLFGGAAARAAEDDTTDEDLEEGDDAPSEPATRFDAGRD
jgi:uncharacterized membrane protein